MPVVKLLSQDARVIIADWKAARVSLYIRKFLDDLEWVGDEDDLLPLPLIDSSVLKKVLEWAEKHKDDDDEPKEGSGQESNDDDLDEWHQAYIDVTPTKKAELISAAISLDMRGLFNLLTRM